MASENNGKTTLPVNKAINKVLKRVCKTGNAHKSNMLGKCKQYAGEEVNLHYKNCYRSKADLTLDFCNRLNLYLGVRAEKQVTTLKTRTDALKAEHEKLSGLLKASAKNIRALRSRFKNVVSHSKKVNKIIAAEQKSNPDIHKELEDNVKDIWTRMDHLGEHSKVLNDGLKQTLKGASRVSGFLEFIDFDKLQASEAVLTQAMIRLKSNIDTNLKNNRAQSKTANEDFQAALGELLQTESKKCTAANIYFGYNDLYPFLRWVKAPDSVEESDFSLTEVEESDFSLTELTTISLDKIEEVYKSLRSGSGFSDVHQEREREQQIEKAERDARRLEASAKAFLTRAAKEKNKLKAEALRLKAESYQLKAEGTRLAAKGDATSTARALKLLKESEVLNRKAEELAKKA